MQTDTYKQHLTQLYGEPTQVSSQQLQRNYIKEAKLQNHLTFLKRCRDSSITPTGLQLKSSISTPQAKLIIHKAGQALVRERRDNSHLISIMKHWHTHRTREAIEIHRHNTPCPKTQDYTSTTSGNPSSTSTRSLLLHHRLHHHLHHPRRHPYINHCHPPNPQSSRQPHSYNAQQTTADYNAVYVGDTHSVSPTAHPTHGFQTPRSRQQCKQSFSRLHQQSLFRTTNPQERLPRVLFRTTQSSLSLTWCTRKPTVYLHPHANRYLQAASNPALRGADPSIIPTTAA